MDDSPDDAITSSSDRQEEKSESEESEEEEEEDEDISTTLPTAIATPVSESEEEEVQITAPADSTSTTGNGDGFAQPMLPPLHHLSKLASAPRSSPFDGSKKSSSTSSSSSSGSSGSGGGHHHKHKKVREKKLEKYNAILASLNYSPPPHGSSLADPRYSLEILKNGAIIDTFNFSPDDQKGYYIIGRVPGCDIVAENPTVSRLHAVFQFVKGPGGENEEDLGTGLYLYDLKSTHGTFINKNQAFPHKFYRIRVGHVLRFGTSQRMYIVAGPSEDEEEESDKSVSELQNEKLQKDLERKREEEEEQLKRNPGMKKERNVEEEGITWGMAEDAEEESDLKVNPFAIDYEASELTLNDPKKSLRSWFEREGHELEYEVREKGSGQYVCRIGLPLDGPTDAPVYAESDVKGKKKEAALDAAMKACQILDSHGLLRGSNQESRKRKEKKYEDEDYYSSDEDTFLDRTGTIEKKREKRMRLAGKLESKVETYDTLCTKHSQLESEIAELTSKLEQSKKKREKNEPEEDIDIDDYVKLLKTGSFDTKKLRARLKEATEELGRTQKLMKIAKPVELPSYLQPSAAAGSSSSLSLSKKPVKLPPPDSKEASKLAEWFPDSGQVDSSSEQVEAKPIKRPPLVGPRKSSPAAAAGSSSSSSSKQKLYGLIKPSELPSLKPPAPPFPLEMRMKKWRQNHHHLLPKKKLRRRRSQARKNVSDTDTNMEKSRRKRKGVHMMILQTPNIQIGSPLLIRKGMGEHLLMRSWATNFIERKYTCLFMHFSLFYYFTNLYVVSSKSE
ncbi:Kanadaptin [Orchesella cincta]|uniref:Kanadaptin n=1 Tax=Orchesella cincta TaxID=48709 RepID=A0A1D2MBJ5_ORCCI|nr:Kanadaptin [Orchesella cincta]